MIFFCRIFYFQQWRPYWLGYNWGPIGDHPKAPSIFPSLVPIGPVVSEENIKIQKDNDERTDDGRPVVSNAHMTLWVG